MRKLRDWVLQGLVVGAVVACISIARAVIPLPGVQGPFLGDQNANIYSIVQALTNQSQNGFTSALSVSQTATQAGCTQLGAAAFQQVSTSAATGNVCLPTATAGKMTIVANATGQTINIFGSATTFTAGTQDTINGTAGTTAYSGLTTGKTAICISPANGAWNCGSIS